MFIPFFQALRAEGLPVSPREFLSFLEALAGGLAHYDLEEFYHLARLSMVKDERFFDRFDRAFSKSFSGLEELSSSDLLEAMALPEDWLRKLSVKILSPEEKAQIEALGGFEQLMNTLRERLAEQKARHEGGNKWIGTGGTSPFGAYGYNPEGIRIGQKESRNQRAVKVWDRREFRNLDEKSELSSRNIKLALRALRRWSRESSHEELDIEDTIRATAHQGWLDLKTRPERRNGVKLLLFLDIGGSMDVHIRVVQELFTAARSEFRHLEVFYFHNCLYEGVWRDNRRRFDEQTPTWQVLQTYGADWRAIFVGDAAMSPYEITHKGGASEHWNEESGAVWLNRAFEHWPHHLWINPLPEAQWAWTQSIGMIRELVKNRMVGMTPEAITSGVKLLR